MGRRAGVTADETRSQLLEAAAGVFARHGYERASIAEICSEAGLSSGAIYGHYGSKAKLFGAVLDAHGAREVDRLLGSGELDDVDVAGLFAALGARLDRRERAGTSLLVEAIVAAKRDPEVAAMLAAAFAAREGFLGDLVRRGQRDGAIDPSVAPDAIARFSLMLALGSLLVSALGLPPNDHDDWSALIGRLVDGFRTAS